MIARTLVLMIGGALALGACASDKASFGQVQEGSTTRSVVRVEQGEITSTLVLPATVQAGAVTSLAAPANGVYRVHEGKVSYVDAAGNTHEIDLPAGISVEQTQAPAGQVPKNFPIAKLKISQFVLVAQLDTAALYRLYSSPSGGRGEITNGPGPFDCHLVNTIPDKKRLLCLVPNNLRVFSGMPGTIAAQTGHTSSSLYLPVQAVAGSAEAGSVWVVAGNDKLVQRNIVLGITDGSKIQIVSGLRNGDRVSIPPPDLADRGSS